MSKGSGRRPRQISAEEEAQNWERIFGKKECTPFTKVRDANSEKNKAEAIQKQRVAGTKEAATS